MKKASQLLLDSAKPFDEACIRVKELEEENIKLKVTIESLIDDLKRQDILLHKFTITKFSYFSDEECWIYDEDGENYLESLVCPVVIRAKTLIRLLGDSK